MPHAAPASSAAELLDALLAFGETEAEAILSEAFALYPLEQVIEEIIAPALVEIGERWHRDEATVVQEHFATALLRRRLTAIFDAYDQPLSGPLAITGAAPSEWHDVGILIVSFALHRHGWRVIYLGQNVPAGQLVQEIGRLHPEIVCLSAATREAARELAQVVDAVKRLPLPRPTLVFGGGAFVRHPELRADFPDAFAAANAHDLIAYLTRRPEHATSQKML